MIAPTYINLPAGCFNPPLSRWNAALSLRCSSDGRSGSKICARAPQTWPQSWTPCSKSSSAAEHKPLPPRNWIQMSQVSVSSIYTLCIFTTGRMISMLARSEENVGAIFFDYSKETRSLSGVSRLSDAVACFQRISHSYFPELFHTFCSWSFNMFSLITLYLIKWTPWDWDLYCKRSQQKETCREKKKSNKHESHIQSMHIYRLHHISHKYL